MSSTPNTTSNESLDERLLRENHERLAAARAHARELGHGYLAVMFRAETVHASTSSMQRHDGYRFPRPRCQGATSLVYASPLADQSTPVTCKRCLASLEARPPKQ